MEFIFNFFGSILGYILWGAFFLVKNFGVAIILFTLIIKLLLFPFSVKQQKSMASTARFQQKQREIMDKYSGDRIKANEEIQKLMQKEDYSPSMGCLPMFAPMLVMFGVIYSVNNPLTNTLHIASDKVSAAMNSLTRLPGIGTTVNSQYGQISIVKYFNSLQKYLVDSSGNALFNKSEIASIEEFGSGFNFCGLDLLATPSQSGFSSMLWLIPVLCFVSSVASMFIIQKINGTEMKGCMALMIFVMPLFSAWIAYNVPGAVGFYWIASTFLGFIQSVIMNKFYSAAIVEAKEEASRIVLRRQQEKNIEYIEVPDYIAPSELKKMKENENKQDKTSPKKNNKSKKSGNKQSGSNYQGKKK